MDDDTPKLLALAAAHMTPNYQPPAMVLARGRGSHVWDLAGREYLDFASGIGVNALGHAHPEVVAALSEQAGRLIHTSNLYHHAPYIELCARLGKLAFGPRVFLANSGAEAVEAALKLARLYFHARGEPRPGFVATANAFHGRTFGALSVTGQASLHTGFGPLVSDVRHVPFADVAAMENAVGRGTAAVIVEPIQGNAGVNIPPPGYLKAVRALCTRHGALLIFDEVQTGIGRTGRWFAHQHEDVTPDLMTLAKAVGGGLPLGALVASEEVAQALKPGTHASTFGGNPVACAAGLATLAVIERDRLVERAAALGEHLLAALSSLAGRSPAVRAVRGRGLMVGVELDRPAKPVLAQCRERGLLATAAGDHVVRLLPPLIVTPSEVEAAVEILAASLG